MFRKFKLFLQSQSGEMGKLVIVTKKLSFVSKKGILSFIFPECGSVDTNDNCRNWAI